MWLIVALLYYAEPNNPTAMPYTIEFKMKYTTLEECRSVAEPAAAELRDIFKADGVQTMCVLQYGEPA